jgi:L-asparaginase
MIGILFTGGTISMTVDPATGAAVPSLGARDLLEKIPAIASVTSFEAEDFSRLPGPHVTPEQMWRLARRAAAWLERPDIEGLVITHGTDTLEETAWFLDLVLDTHKPVVLLGAMRTSSEPSWDGPGNLINAARVAASPQSCGRGVLVAMDEQIITAREVRKVHTESSSSFRSPSFGPVGVIDGGRIRYCRAPGSRISWRDPTAEPLLRVVRHEPNVELVSAYAGASDIPFRAAVAAGARGIAVDAFGRGNVTPAMRRGIAYAREHAVPVLIASRCTAGSVAPRYGYEGGARDLQNLGVMLAADLGGPKARILLMIALGLTSDPAELRQVISVTVS